MQWIPVVLLHAVFGCCVAKIGKDKGRSELLWFAFGFLFPTFGLYYVVLANDISGRKFPRPVREK